MKRIRTIGKLAIVVLTLGVAVMLSGCGAKAQEPFQDAPRGATNGAPADTINMPDGYSNIATKCDHGNRVYSAFHGDAPYGSIAVVAKDPTCPQAG